MCRSTCLQRIFRPCVADLWSRGRRLGSILSGAPVRPAEGEITFSTLTDLRIGIRTCIVGQRLAGGASEPAGRRHRRRNLPTEEYASPSPEMVLLEGDLTVAVGESGALRH